MGLWFLIHPVQSVLSDSGDKKLVKSVAQVESLLLREKCTDMEVIPELGVEKYTV
jgi:hypothetical protein